MAPTISAGLIARIDEPSDRSRSTNSGRIIRHEMRPAKTNQTTPETGHLPRVQRRNPMLIENKFPVAGLLIVILTPGLTAQTNRSDSTANRAAKTPSVPAATAAYVPLNQKERFDSYVHHMFGPETIFRTSAGAGINQLMNTPSEWKQGASGYGLRWSSIYGEHVIHSTVMYGTSVALHEDNRYFQSGLTGFGPRLKYALASTFLARHENGTRHLSVSRMSGFVTAAAISRLWQPPSTSHFENAADSFGVGIGVEAGFNVAREFFPRLFHSQPPIGTAPVH